MGRKRQTERKLKRVRDKQTDKEIGRERDREGGGGRE